MSECLKVLILGIPNTETDEKKLIAIVDMSVHVIKLLHYFLLNQLAIVVKIPLVKLMIESKKFLSTVTWILRKACSLA